MFITIWRSGHGIRFALLALFLQAGMFSTPVSAVAQDAKETGAWIVKILLNNGKDIHMGPGVFGSITDATSSDCNIIITTSVELSSEDVPIITKNEIPMRFFKEMSVKKFTNKSKKEIIFIYTEDEDILWTQSDEFSSNDHQNSNYAIVPFKFDGRDIAKRMDKALRHFAKLAGESKKCRNAEPF